MTSPRPDPLPGATPRLDTSESVLPTWQDLSRISAAQVPGVWSNDPQDLDAEQVLLATVQPRSAYARLRSTGRLGGDWAAVPPDFAAAYAWMQARLSAHTRTPLTAPPVWTWFSAPAQTLLADLVGHAERAEPAALLTVTVSPARFLLSAHEGWHHALNGTWCPVPTVADNTPGHEQADRDTYAAFLAAADAQMGRSDWSLDDLPCDLRRRVETSWRWCLVPSLYPHSAVQAAVAEIRAAEVVAAACLTGT